MAAPLSQVFYPFGFQELFSAWNRFPDAVLYAGGTGLLRDQGRRVPVLPKNIISLSKMEELHRINRTERYLEIGAMVKLSQILRLGKMVPEALAQCIEAIAGPELRNLATIGGNLCNAAQRLDCPAAMLALDAQYELRTAQSARWVAASRFSSLPGPPALAPQELLTRVRVPLEPWTYTWYRKFRAAGQKEPGEVILFIIRNEKNILTNIRVVYSGDNILREKNCETMLAGKRLPLEIRDAEAFVESWRDYLSAAESLPQNPQKKTDETPPENSPVPAETPHRLTDLTKAQILSFIETTILSISE